MSEIRNKTVDGMFKGGKWGMYAGAAAGAFVALTMLEPQFVFNTFILGPFGAAATLGIAGAAAGLLAGAAIGAVGGLIYGALKTASHSPEQDQKRFSERSRPAPSQAASQSIAQEQTMNLPEETSSVFQDRLRQAREAKRSGEYRGL